MPAGETYDGQVRVFWLDADPTDPNAPTEAELTDGVDLSGYVLPETIDYGFKNDTVEDRDALSSFDPQSAGRHGAHPTMDFRDTLRATGARLAWDTLGDRLITGCLVTFEGVAEGAEVNDGDACRVFTGCETGQPMPRNVALNTARRFGVEFFVGGLAYQRAIVGGS